MTECASSTGSIRGSQPDGKGRAFAKGAGDVEPAAMAVEHVLDDRQAETGAPQLSRSGVVDPVEALGQARQVLIWYAVALVGNRDPQHRGPGPIAGPGGDR